MNKRIATTYLGVCVSLLQVASAASTVPLAPAGAFSIESALPGHWRASPFQVHRFRVSGSSLYFLVSQGPTTDDSIVLETDFDGHPLAVLELGSGATVREFDVDRGGNVYILFGRPEDEIVIFDHKSKSVVRRLPSKNAFSIAVLDGTGILTFYFDGRVTVTSATGSVRSVSERFQFPDTAKTAAYMMASGLEPGYAVLVDGVSALVQVIDTTAGAPSPKAFEIRGPEVTASRALPAFQDALTGGTTPIVIPAISTDDRRALYAFIGFYKIDDDAPATLLGFDASGSPVGGFRMSPSDKRDLPPHYFGTSATQVFLVAPNGSVAAFYRRRR